MKHAFLILAHNEFNVLKLLVSCLDDSRNDIFIHFDKKVQSLPDIRTKQAGLTILQERVDVRWGAPSMVEAEFALFEAACSRSPYQYYHLLSGVDLPIKGQDYIHDYFDRYDGDEFIGYTWTQMPPDFARKVKCWHLFPEDFKSRSFVKKALRAGFLRLQELLGVKRNRNVDFKKGSQWVSITDGMARYFLDHKDWIRKTFRNTFCCDELVMQTLCWMSPYRQRIHSLESDTAGCMRAIGWQENPAGGEMVLQDWSEEDFDFLRASPALFARKFNGRDPGFLRKICELAAR
ncbi:MAG: glycosyl transferase [Bacteroidales bacterium]|nr:glycosyl transferase [Bacteroidales bacterium]